MKKLFLISLLFAAICVTAQSDKYVAAMKKNIDVNGFCKNNRRFSKRFQCF